MLDLLSLVPGVLSSDIRLPSQILIGHVLCGQSLMRLFFNSRATLGNLYSSIQRLSIPAGNRLHVAMCICSNYRRHSLCTFIFDKHYALWTNTYLFGVSFRDAIIALLFQVMVDVIYECTM
jgi:hypothetical protein